MATALDARPSRTRLRVSNADAKPAPPECAGGGHDQGRELSAAAAAELHRFVARRVANHADAQDIAQQALLQAWTKLDSCRSENLAPWLFAIARHLIVDHYRAKGRVQWVDVAAPALAETEPALQTPRDAVLAVCECRARLSGWLECVSRRLQLDEQLAVLLADIYGHRDKDSALLLGTSLPSFKLLLHGARARLHVIAGGKCNVVADTRGVGARDTSIDCCGHEGDGCSGGGRPCLAPPYRVGLARRPGTARLVALRRKLLQGLKALLVGLSALDPLAALLF